MKGRMHLELGVLLSLVLVGPSLATVTVTVTGDAVFSGETATLTCTASVDAGETLLTKRWQVGDEVIAEVASSNTVTKNGVVYLITDLALSVTQIVNWKIEVQSVTSDVTNFKCFVLASVGAPTTEVGIVDVMTITPTKNYVATGGTAAVTCTLGQISSSQGGNPTVEWSQNSSPISNGGSYALSTDFSGSDKIAVLSVTGATSDQTYTCKFTPSKGGSVTSTVDLDYVTITTTSDVVSSGGSAGLDCVLAGASQAPVARKWYDSTPTEISIGGGYTFWDKSAYNNGGQTFYLSISSVTQDTTFTCCYQFISGSCINTNAQVKVITITATNYLVKVGGNTDISCVVTNAASQPSTITWKTSAGTISSGITNSGYSGNSQTTTLAVNSISTDTVYTCEFVISGVPVSKDITIDTVTITPTTGTALSGGTVIVSCQIVGASLEPTVSWKDGGSSVDTGVSNDPWTSSTGTFLTKLTVNGLTSSKSYTCEFDISGRTVSETVAANILSIAAVGTTTDTGSAATITCTITDSTAAPTSVFWKDANGNNVVMTNGFSKSENTYTSGSQEAKLVLGTSTISSDTSYTCVFVVESVGYESTAAVDHITVTSADASALASSSGTVSCVLAGAGSTPTVEWFDSSSVKKTTADTGYTVTTGALSGEGLTTSLASTADTSDTTYTCKFTFSNGVVEKVTTLDIVTVTGTNDVVKSGGTATITCSLAGSLYAPSENAWYLGDVEKPTGGVYIASLGSYDSGADTQVMELQKSSVTAVETYRCSFTINAARIDGSAKIVSLSITAKNYAITANSGIAISCAIVGAESDPTVTWKTSSGSISTGISDSAFQDSDGSKTSTLNIGSVSSDTTYTCDFTMGAETVSDTIDVDTVTLTKTDGTALSGDTITLTCQVSGAGTQPSVAWKDGGSPVSSGVSNDPWVSSTGTLLSKLTVSGLTSNKDYTCTFTVDGSEVTTTVTANLLTIAEVGTTTYTGATSSVTCTVSNAQADPSLISWKDANEDNIVSGTKSYTITNGNFNGASKQSVLTLNTALITSDTTFTCVFIVEGSTVQKIVSVDHVSITPHSFTKLSAASTTVSCVLAGAGTTPTVEWFDSSSVKKTSSDSGYTVTPGSLSGGGLTTSLVHTSDTTDTTYTCKFTFSDAVLSQTTTVDVVTITPGNDIVKAGGTATISCTLGASQFTTTLAKWTLGVAEKTTGGEYIVDVGAYNNAGDQTHKMVLERSNAAVAESYTCIFTASGVTVQGTATTTVYTTTSASDTIKAGETATVTCGISGLDAQPTIGWTDSVGGTVSSGGVNTISTPTAWTSSSGSISTQLQVTGLSADAKYTCTFTLSDGSTESETVNVYFVSVAVTSSASTIVSGSSVSLTCVLTGSSTTPTGPVWNDGSSDLSDGGGLTINPGSFGGGTQTSTLTVTSLTTDTTYSCSFTISSTTVTQSAAVDVLSVSVSDTVIAPGEVATITCTVSDIGTAVTIAWTGYSTGITAGTLQGDKTQNSVLEVSYLSSQTTITCVVTRDTFSTTSNGQVTVLDSCAKGSYYHTSGLTTTCTPCATGSYTDNPYLRSCTACPNSGTTLFTGSSSVNQCYSKTADLSVVMKSGDTVTLTAWITVSDTVSGATWTSSNGGSLTDTESTNGNTFTSTLQVSSWAAQTFTCTFSVTRTGESTPATTTVTVTAVTAAIIDQPAATAQSPGSSYTLSCSADLPPSGLAVQSGWLQDGEQVDIIMTTADETLSNKVKSTLTIGYLTSDMTGNYACFFKYALSSSLSTSTYKVTSDTTYLAVEGISMFPAQSGGVTGSSATITCLGVSSADAVSVQWKINGVPVLLSSTLTVTNTYSTVSSSKESKSVLAISSLSSTEEGSVECFMLFGANWFSSSGTMNVISIAENPSDVDAFKGVAAEMHCVVEGPPGPTIEWYKDSVKVDDSWSTNAFSSDSSQYTSTLTISTAAKSNEGNYKCKATWATELGMTGGNTESAGANLRVYGVNFITANSEVAQNGGLKLQCRIDDFETSAIIWKKDGVTVSGDGIQRHDSDNWYDTISATTSSIGSFQYSCLAKYTHASGEISYSGAETTTVTVHKTCSSLSNPTGGTVVCTGTATDKTCTVTCNTDYVPRATPRTFTCTDGTWDLEPSSTDCTAKATPSSYRLTYTAVYNYPIPCTTTWGPYILAAYPYHMNNAESSLTNVPAAVQMDSNSFECINNPTDCTSASTCQQIKIKFEYVQTTSLTNDDPLQTTRTEIASYVSSNSLDVLGLLNTASRLDSNGNLQGSYSGKKKRSTEEKYAGPGFVLEPTTEGSQSSSETVQCPEFTIMVDDQCTTCGHGWFISGRDCSPCPLGTYQKEEDSNKCTPCLDGLSTLVTAATSPLMCVEVCRVRKPLHGTVHPPEDTMLASPSDVTVLCDEGFSMKNGNHFGDVSCDEEVHCSRIQLVDVPEYIIRDTHLTVNCVVEAKYHFENCSLNQNGVAVQTEFTFADNNRQICSFDVSLTSSTELSCSAENPQVHLTGKPIEVSFLKPAVKANAEAFLASDMMNLACSAIVPSGHSVQMRWKKHGEVIGTSSFSHSSLGLIIHTKKDVQFEDSGEYSCEVEYLGIGVSESESIPIRVVGFLEELSDFSLYEGQSVRISCVLPTGRSISMLEWYRDGERQNDQGSTVDGQELRIISSELTVAYPGTYECRGDAIGVNFSSVAVVGFNKDYGFIVHPESQYIIQGSYATFSCRFSDENVKIQWLLDDSPMEEKQNNRASLHLATLQTDKLVQCVATLPTGEQILSKKAKAIVRRFITEPSDTVLGDDDATFHCSVYGPLIAELTWETEYGDNIQPTTITQMTAVELHATLSVSTSNKLRCVVTFESGDRLVSSWASTLSYDVTIGEQFVLLNKGFLATCKIHSDEAPSAVFWKTNSYMLFEDSDVIYDGYQGYSESSYYMTSLTGIQVAEISCTAAFRGVSITVTSSQKSLAPLGITSHPRDISVIQDTEEVAEASCEFYDYPEVQAVVTWSTDSLEELDVTTTYVRENTAKSTVRIKLQTAGQFLLSCSVHYSHYGTVVSDSAFVSILKPISVEAVSTQIGYGEIAEVQGVMPVSDSSHPQYHWSVNGVYITEQVSSHNETYVSSELRWPIMQDSTITLTVFSNGEISRESVFIKVYGIRSMTVEGTIEFGSSADLICIVDGNVPPTDLFWYFNTVRHAPTFTHQLGTMTRSVLSLEDIEPSSFGHYTCVAGYSDRPSVFQRMPVVPLGACALPQILNGHFDSNFISEGNSATVTCSPSYTVPDDNDSLTCKDGVLVGRTPVCVQVLRSTDSTASSYSLLVVLVTCACVVMTCSVILSFLLWYKKRSKASKKITDDLNGDPYPVQKEVPDRVDEREAEEMEPPQWDPLNKVWLTKHR